MSIFTIAEAATDQQQIPYWLNYSQAMSQIVLALGVFGGGAMAIGKYRRRNDNPTPSQSVNKLDSAGFWIFGLTILAAAIGWAGSLYNRGDWRTSIIVLILIFVIVAPIAIIVLWREIAASRRRFNPKKIVYAEYGNTRAGFRYWADTGRSGEALAEYLRELFKRTEPARLTNDLLNVPDPPDTGSHQLLRFRLSDGRCFHLHEYGMITIDSAITTPPFQPLSKTILAKTSEEAIPNTPSPFAGVPEELINHMWGNRTHVKLKDGMYELGEGDRITTKGSFKTPMAFRLLAKTNDTNIRIDYVQEEIIFNWEVNREQGYLHFGLRGPLSGKDKRGMGNIPVNEFVTIDIIAKQNLFTILVNNSVRFSELIDLSKIDQPFAVFQGFGAIVHVKSILAGPPKPD